MTVPKSEASLQELRIALLLTWIDGHVPDHRSRLFVWGVLQNDLERGLRLPGFTETEVRRAIGEA